MRSSASLGDFPPYSALRSLAGERWVLLMMGWMLAISATMMMLRLTSASCASVDLSMANSLICDDPPMMLTDDRAMAVSFGAKTWSMATDMPIPIIPAMMMVKIASIRAYTRYIRVMSRRLAPIAR